MNDEQVVKTVLDVPDIDLEPGTPEDLRLTKLIQRVFALSFGKRGNAMIPLRVSKAGVLAVTGGGGGVPLADCTLHAAACNDETWVDTGVIFDRLLVGVYRVMSATLHLSDNGSDIKAYIPPMAGGPFHAGDPAPETGWCSWDIEMPARYFYLETRGSDGLGMGYTAVVYPK